MRAVSEVWLLPALGGWLDRALRHHVHRRAHACTASASCWCRSPRTRSGSSSCAAGCFQVGVPVFLTWALLQFVLLPTTNLSFSSLELTYEDVAQNFLASPQDVHPAAHHRVPRRALQPPLRLGLQRHPRARAARGDVRRAGEGARDVAEVLRAGPRHQGAAPGAGPADAEPRGPAQDGARVHARLRPQVRHRLGARRAGAGAQGHRPVRLRLPRADAARGEDPPEAGDLADRARHRAHLARGLRGRQRDRLPPLARRADPGRGRPEAAGRRAPLRRSGCSAPRSA